MSAKIELGDVVRPLPPDTSPGFGAPTAPPREWFERPTDLEPGQRLTVASDGRVAGYFYTHAGRFLSDGIRYAIRPSPSGYRDLFHRATVECAAGEMLDVGVITRSGHPHVLHDSDPADVVAIVKAYDDEHGGYVCGSLVPEATVSTAALVRRSGLSGEWDETESGAEMRSLRLVATPAAVLHRSYRGFSPRYDRLDVDVVRDREYEFRRILRTVLDEHSPSVAVSMLRTLFDDLDAKDLADRVASIKAPRPLPPRVPLNGMDRRIP